MIVRLQTCFQPERSLNRIDSVEPEAASGQSSRQFPFYFAEPTPKLTVVSPLNGGMHENLIDRHRTGLTSCRRWTLHLPACLRSGQSALCGRELPGLEHAGSGTQPEEDERNRAERSGGGGHARP